MVDVARDHRVVPRGHVASTSDAEIVGQLPGDEETVILERMGGTDVGRPATVEETVMAYLAKGRGSAATSTPAGRAP